MLPVRKATPVNTSSAAHHLLHAMKIVAEAGQKRRERLYREGGNDKRNAKAKRIDCKEARASAYRLLGRRNGQNRSQNRSDAWRPAERKCEPDDIGPP